MRLSDEKIRAKILWYEEQYPEFKECSLENEVAMIYGWGPAITAFENYQNLLEFLEVEP